MKINEYRYIVPLIVVALLLLGVAISGCLVSGTKAFSLPLTPPPLVATDGAVNETRINLAKDETFQEYQDEIRLIDRIGFKATIVENQGDSESMSIYFSATGGMSSAAQVRAEAALMFENYPIPAGSTVMISYDESQKILKNFDELRTLALTGEFSIYTLADDSFRMTFENLEFIVTFTVGL